MVAAGSFRVLQAALFPVGTIGYVWAVPKLLRYSRRTGVSATLLASLYTRYMQHRLKSRPDEPAARLLLAMPNVSRTAFRLETAPTLAAHHLTGHVPRIYRYPYEGDSPMRHQQTARTSYYDDALRRHLPGMAQLVILGAGFDTRAYRLPAEHPVRCFEIDRPPTQAFKRRMLITAGLGEDRATYVAADFQADDWFERLVAAGFDPARPAFFLWEAVTMYLDRAAVETTLRRIGGTAPGSVVAFDYFSGQAITSRSPFMRYARAATRFAGEPLTFGIDNAPPARAGAAAFVGTFGLTLEEHRNFGRETRRRPAPAGFIAAVVGRPAQLGADGAAGRAADRRSRKVPNGRRNVKDGSMTETYDASRPVESDAPEAVNAAVRDATSELSETLRRHGIEVAFEDIARLGHSESWDDEGQRWVQVTWRDEEPGGAASEA